MGLGKTIQAIAFICAVLDRGCRETTASNFWKKPQPNNSPVLIVAPGQEDVFQLTSNSFCVNTMVKRICQGWRQVFAYLMIISGLVLELKSIMEKEEKVIE